MSKLSSLLLLRAVCVQDPASPFVKNVNLVGMEAAIRDHPDFDGDMAKATQEAVEMLLYSLEKDTKAEAAKPEDVLALYFVTSQLLLTQPISVEIIGRCFGPSTASRFALNMLKRRGGNVTSLIKTSVRKLQQSISRGELHELVQ